jgi:hypothetical protein
MAEQLGFGFEQMAEEKETAHLPGEMEQGIAHYRGMLEQHNAAMLAGDEKGAVAVQKEAVRLAVKLNDGEPGILGGPEAPGYVLMNATAALPGTVPMWGQKGEFDIKVGEMPVHIKMDGMLGISRHCNIWPGFSAHAIDYDKPFLSETGFRSFIGVHANLVPGLTPDTFAREVIQHFLKTECKGKLRKIGATYVEREMARRAEKDNQQKEPDL